MKSFIKIFIFLFLIIFIIANKGEVGEIFNYKKIYSELFEKIESQETGFSEESLFSKSDFPKTDKENVLEISKLGIEVPIIFGESESIEDMEKALDSGVAHYPSSDLPGEEGRSLILGHSAPFGWPKINYEWVFSDLNNLEKGNEVFVHFEGRRYSYVVQDKYILEKGEEIPSQSQSTSELVLISCWPPGKDLKRLAVTAVLALPSE